MNQDIPTADERTNTLAEAVEKHVSAQTLSAAQLQQLMQLQSIGNAQQAVTASNETAPTPRWRYRVRHVAVAAAMLVEILTGFVAGRMQEPVTLIERIAEETAHNH